MPKKILTVILLFLGLHLYASAKWDTLLQSGIDEFQKGQYSFAVTNLKKYILLSDDEINKPKALYYLAESYYFDEKYNQSLLYIDELTAKYKMSEYAAQSYFWKGLINQNMSNWIEAEDAFLKFIRLMPGSELADRANLAIANCRFEQGKLDDALVSLESIVVNEKSEKYEEASVLYCYILMKQKKNEQLVEILEKWNKKLGEDGGKYSYKDRFWLYLAEYYIQQDNDEAAYVLLKKIDNNAPGSPSSDIALLRLSEIESRAGDNEVAAEYIKRLKNEYPASIYNIDALLNTGILMFNEDSYEQAAGQFTSVYQLANERIATLKNNDEIERLETIKSRTLLYKSEALSRINKTEDAIAQLSLLLQEGLPNREEAVIKMAELYYATRNFKKLQEHLVKYDKTIIDPVKRERFILIRAKYLYETGAYKESLDAIAVIDQNSKYYINAVTVRVKDYAAMGDFTGAVALLREILGKTEIAGRPAVVYALMSINFNAGDYKEVIGLRDLMNIYSKQLTGAEKQDYAIKTLYLAALSYMQQKAYDNGIGLIKELQSYKDRNDLTEEQKTTISTSYYYLGWLYYKKSLYKDAAANFALAGAVIKEPSLKQDALFMEGWSYYSAGAYQDAATRFMKIVTLYSPATIAVKALFHAAKSYQNIGDMDKAAAYYKRIYQEFGDTSYRADALYELIRYAFDQKKSEEANNYIKEFGLSFQDNPLYRSVLVMQMENFLVEERYSEVLASALNYLQKYGDTGKPDNVYYWAGVSAYKNRDYETAEGMYQKIIQNYPESTFYETTLQNLIVLYKDLGQYKKEMDSITLYLGKYKDPGSYAMRKAVLQQIVSGVSEDEARLVALSESGDLSARYTLAKLYIEKGNEEKGGAMMSDLQKSDKGEAGARANNYFGDLEYKKENYKDALVLYAATISSYKGAPDTDAEALYKAAYCYYKLNRNDQALKFIDVLKKKYPDSKWIPNAEALRGNMQ